MKQDNDFRLKDALVPFEQRHKPDCKGKAKCVTCEDFAVLRAMLRAKKPGAVPRSPACRQRQLELLNGGANGSKNNEAQRSAAVSALFKFVLEYPIRFDTSIP